MTREEETKYVTSIDYIGPHLIQTTSPLSVNFTVQTGDKGRLHEDCAVGAVEGRTMTRENARDWMIALRANYRDDGIIANAFTIAIEALEQTEIIKCKNCCFYAISKEKRSWCKDMLRRIQPEDFCSHAKIK